MRIAPRTMQFATGWRVDENIVDHFDELAQLCALTGDKFSLVIGMAGVVGSYVVQGRPHEASRLASEQMSLLDSLGDPTPKLALSFTLFAYWFERGQFDEILRWSQTVIDLAEGDPAKGAGFGVDSPLAMALTWRGVARWWLDRRGWRQDLYDAAAMARNSNAGTIVGVRAWTYGLAIYYGVLRADDSAVRAIEEAVQTAEVEADDFMLGVAKYNLGFALLNRNAAADRDRGLELVVQARDMLLRLRSPFMVPLVDLWAARERARRGNLDAAIPVMREAVNELHRAGRIGYGVWGTGVLVETLLQRGAAGDLSEAEEQIDWLANVSADNGSAALEITLLRLGALLAGPAVTTLPIATWRVGIARWRNRLASKDTSSGPKRLLRTGSAEMTAGVACGSCGTRLCDNARFCDECGAPTAISADAAEYKQVSGASSPPAICRRVDCRPQMVRSRRRIRLRPK